MIPPGIPGACQKAREAMSLQLDGELSEVGAAGLAAHLRECGACAACAGELSAITSRLRATPLESPTRLPLLRRAGRPARAATAMAAVAVVSGLTITVGSLRSDHSNTVRASTVAATDVRADIFIIRQLDPLGGFQPAFQRSGPTPI
jgi:predicted anti-sigma-YlaC factor YlaD